LDNWPHLTQKKTGASVTQTAKSGGGQQAAHTDKTTAATTAKKKAGLKGKAQSAKRKQGVEGHVLGDADYVDLMMGGRRKARKEASKLPEDE